MNTIEGTIKSIAVDSEQITIHGVCSAEGHTGPLVFSIHERQPYEPDPQSVDGESGETFTVVTQAGDKFTLALKRFAGSRDRIYSRFKVGAFTDSSNKVTLLDGPCHVDVLGPLVSASDYAYPTFGTIKGLQVKMVDDALELGVGHAALNINLPTIIRPAKTEDTITYHTDGHEYYFDAAYLSQFDRRVKELSDHGIVVNLILLNSVRWDGIELYPEMKETLLHPDYDPEGRISAFNVITEDGLAHYRAFVEFVAERYTRPDAKYGRACGYIIGNEVDAQWIWCNAGRKTVREYVSEYATAVRTAFYAARKKYSQARVYISLTHYWQLAHREDPGQCYKGRDVIEVLNEICLRDGNYDWSLAFHPYPEDLFHPDFWNDKTAIDSFDTPRITFKNIEVLPRYMSQSHLLYDKRPRHIILSEQGFHSDETEEGEQLQAAAYAYAYYKIERTPSIESFILHAHVDHRDEFDLNLGLWRRDKESPLPNAPGSPKPIHAVFRDIDGPGMADLVSWAKQIVGEDNWT